MNVFYKSESKIGTFSKYPVDDRGAQEESGGAQGESGGALPALRPGPGPTRLFLSPKENMSYEHEWSVKSSLT